MVWSNHLHSIIIIFSLTLTGFQGNNNNSYNNNNNNNNNRNSISEELESYSRQNYEAETLSKE